jgi:hypothetical protein
LIVDCLKRFADHGNNVNCGRKYSMNNNKFAYKLLVAQCVFCVIASMSQYSYSMQQQNQRTAATLLVVAQPEHRCAIDSTFLDAYVGRYIHASAYMAAEEGFDDPIIIAKVADKVYVRLPKASRIELHPMSEDVFTSIDGAIQITLLKNRSHHYRIQLQNGGKRFIADKL